MKEKKYNFIYETTNLINGKLYRGVHCTDKLEDGYIGCGIACQGNANSTTKTSPFIKAVRKYKYENFKMVPVKFFDTREEAYEAEKDFVNEEWIFRKDTYNVTVGGIVNKQFKGSITRESHASSKKVKNKITGEVYDSIQTVAEILGMKHSTLSNKLKGRCFNDTDYELTGINKPKERLKAPTHIKYTDIEEYDLQGNFIRRYKYLNEISGTTRTNILRTLTSKTDNVAGGSLWRVKDIYSGETLGFTDETFKFYVYSENGEYKARFIKISQCAEYLGYSKNSCGRILDKIKKGKPVKKHFIYGNKQET